MPTRLSSEPAFMSWKISSLTCFGRARVSSSPGRAKEPGAAGNKGAHKAVSILGADAMLCDCEALSHGESRPERTTNGARAKSSAARIAVFLLAVYKVYVSPVLPSSCRFYPTCSDYAREAVERHGFLRGSRLTLRRLSRCQPFSQGGYDPVPDA